MARLWIANTTNQRHTFIYRPKIGEGGVKEGVLLAKFGEMRRYDIPVGGQVAIGGDRGLEDGEIRGILDQHPHIVNFDELKRVNGYQGLCYRIGPNEVPIEKILERIDANDKARTDVAKDRQMQTTLEIANRMRNVSGQDGAAFTDLHETNVQVEQVPAQEVNDGTSKINTVVKVPEDGKTPTQRGPKSGG